MNSGAERVLFDLRTFPRIYSGEISIHMGIKPANRVSCFMRMRPARDCQRVQD
jgi:hypothetical protein